MTHLTPLAFSIAQTFTSVFNLGSIPDNVIFLL